jgi:hypothetical protein
MSDAGVIRKVAELPITASANTKHTMNGAMFPPSRPLVMEEQPEGCFLFRYADNWAFAGDTWHANSDDLLHQIKYEFEVIDLD